MTMPRSWGEGIASVLTSRDVGGRTEAAASPRESCESRLKGDAAPRDIAGAVTLGVDPLAELARVPGAVDEDLNIGALVDRVGMDLLRHVLTIPPGDRRLVDGCGMAVSQGSRQDGRVGRQDDGSARVVRLFDEMAEDYDESGVAFFRPIARGLVDLLAPAPGERLVDVGCGRGAVTFAVAGSVGETGRVTAVDIAPAMVELTRRQAEDLGLAQVRTAVVSADDLGLPEASADIVASSLVLFFAPDPFATLRSWIRLLVPGGRIGIATFGDPDPVWKSIDDLFRPYLPEDLLDPRTSGVSGPFATDEGVEELFAACGASEVRTVRRPITVHFGDATQWRRFSMSTGQRAFWSFVPEEDRGQVFARIAELLEGTRGPAGDLTLVQDVRYTVGIRASN
jgi:ubiquinone/menaquinone biosynthesis C-methylase UbiE